MSDKRLVFNPPPGWPKPPEGWQPPKGWTPDPSWPDPPDGWQLWLPADTASSSVEDVSGAATETQDRCDEASQDGMSDSDRRIALLEAEVAALRTQLDEPERSEDTVILDDERVLQEAGVYRYHHVLENAAAYKDRLSDLSARIAELVKTKQAIEVSSSFAYDNSLAKGRRMTSDLSKLMLRAYNAEVDNCLRTMRIGNVLTAKKRIEASRAAIKKLGRMMDMQISEAFHGLRLEELELTADYLAMKQEEKEAAREERARLREERKVQAELAAQREKLAKERSHLMNALKSMKADGKTDPELERKLADLDSAIAENDYRAANIRAGYVYVISNRGAFGEGVVKIGLTRRLEPIDRVNELSGASVPFRFDVHCLIFSEDAVSLESELHEHFSGQRVNFANMRKEFFFATPEEVREAITPKVGKLLEFTETAEPTEYLQSIRYWPESHQTTRRQVEEP